MTKSSRKLKIGFAYDYPVKDKSSLSPDSLKNEYEDVKTLDWIRSVLSTIGQVIDLPWERSLVLRLPVLNLDVIFNITEAAGSRNRESLLPAVAETLDIPFTGSDAVCLGICLDKTLTKITARHLGIATPPFIRIDSFSEWENVSEWMNTVPFPLIAKPNTGGSSLGIKESCRVETIEELREAVRWILEDCSDSALVERFIIGREIDCGLLYREKLETLPLLELRFNGGDPECFNSFEIKSVHRRETLCPAPIQEETACRIRNDTQKLFRFLGCRDIARADFRLGIDGIPYFLEINPLPGLSPFSSALPIQARAAGIEPEEVIRQLIRNAFPGQAPELVLKKGNRKGLV